MDFQLRHRNELKIREILKDETADQVDLYIENFKRALLHEKLYQENHIPVNQSVMAKIAFHANELNTLISSLSENDKKALGKELVDNLSWEPKAVIERFFSSSQTLLNRVSAAAKELLIIKGPGRPKRSKFPKSFSDLWWCYLLSLKRRPESSATGKAVKLGEVYLRQLTGSSLSPSSIRKYYFVPKPRNMEPRTHPFQFDETGKEPLSENNKACLGKKGIVVGGPIYDNLIPIHDDSMDEFDSAWENMTSQKNTEN